MQRVHLPHRIWASFFYTWTFIVALLGISTYSAAQQSKLAPFNSLTSTPWINTTGGFVVTESHASLGLSCWGGEDFCAAGSANSPDNVIDADLTNFAQTSVAISGAASIQISDASNTYSGGNFAGFLIRNSSLVGVSLLNAVTIKTYSNGAFQEQSSAASILGVSSSLVSGAVEVGFYTKLDFDAIEITFTNPLTLVTAYDVFYAVMRGYQAASSSPACNMITALNAPTYPAIVNPANTGIDGVAAIGSITNPDAAVSESTTDYASLDLTTGVLSTGMFAVKLQAVTPASSLTGTFAGFDIETATLLSANVLSSATISLYNNGTLVQTGADNDLVVGATSALLTGTTRQIVGLVATVPYDEIKLTFNQPVDANLGTIRIYSAVVEKLCATTIACGNTYYLSSPAFPAIIDAARTGVAGIAGAASTIQDPWNVVSASTTDFARITNAAEVGTISSIAVLDPVNTFPVGTFAGFTVRKNTFLATADLFPYLTITTYLDGKLQESKTGSSLLDLSVIVQLFGTSTDFFNVGFVTTKAFDEVQISVSSLVGALSQNVDVYGAFVDTRTTVGGGLFCLLNTKPDLNVTNQGQAVTGSVRTNDVVPSDAAYGQPSAPSSSPTGSTSTLTVSSAGSYTFTSATPGIYVYDVPVCAATQTANCPSQPLTITVLDPAVRSNKPVANPDIASVAGDPITPVAATINILVNDGPGNSGGVLGTPTIATPPAHGTAGIDDTGNLVYTPTAGYYGSDVLTYQICEPQSSSNCSTAAVTITVNAPGSPTVNASDDYISTAGKTQATGNVLTNDQGTGLTVSNAGTTTTPDNGTLVLTSTGSYTFTPAPGVSGPVDFTYTACDNGATSTCATATLHVLVNPAVPDLTPNLTVSPSTIIGTRDLTLTLRTVEVSGNATNGSTITMNLRSGSNWTIGITPGTVINGWTYTGLSGLNYKFTSNLILNNNYSDCPVPITFTSNGSRGNYTFTLSLSSTSGGEVNGTNNSDQETTSYEP